MKSSYKENCYGNVFRSLVLAHKPKNVVECGILNGYSLFHISHALRFNYLKRGIKSTFFAYDIFDSYEYNHGNYNEVNKMLIKQRLNDYCTVVDFDAFDASCFYKEESIDFLHFDISNDGDVLLKMLDVWGSKISKDGIIAFEGGSTERDKGWIREYGKKPIKNELINNPIVYKNWDVQIFSQFPSLTLLFPKVKKPKYTQVGMIVDKSKATKSIFDNILNGNV